MAQKPNSSKKLGTHICTFCTNPFPKDQIWWLTFKMHRNDPDCKSFYSSPSCEKCKDDPKNSWAFVGISEEPKPKIKNKKS